jgi:hypothetical protein
MSNGPIMINPGNAHIHAQRVGLYLRVVGPEGTEFDYWCFMAKAGRLRFIVNLYHYGIRVSLEWWPGGADPAIKLFQRFRRRTLRPRHWHREAI